MNFLCDVHLPLRLVRYLSEKNHQAIHVNQLPEKWFTPDHEICRYADQNNFILITKDSDFRTSFILKKSPKKLIRITLGNIANDDLIELFEKHYDVLVENLQKELCYIEINQNDVLVIYAG